MIASEATLLQRKQFNKKIKVAHLVSGDGVWGVENYILNLATEIQEHNVSSVIVCSREDNIAQKYRQAGLPVKVVNMSGYLQPTAYFDLIKLLVCENADLLHVHLGVDSFIGAIVAAHLNIKCVSSMHFDHPSYVKAPWLTREIWRLVQIQKNRYIDHFLPITANVASELSAREKVPPNKITVVHPGIEPNPYDMTKRTQTRQELGLARNDFAILAVGRLELEKDFACIVDAVALLEPSLPVKLFIVGMGSQESVLKAKIEQKGLHGRAQLLGYRTDVPALLNAADAFVLASKKEPFGMAAVEAMFAGLPVIGTIGPGLSTIVDDRSTGILVPPECSQSVARAISVLSQDRDLSAAYGRAAKKKAQERFSAKVFADSVARIYSQVLASV